MRGTEGVGNFRNIVVWLSYANVEDANIFKMQYSADFLPYVVKITEVNLAGIIAFTID